MTTPLGPQFRPPRGAVDADAVLTLLTACAAVAGFDPLSTTESLPTREELAERLATADPRRTLLLEYNGQLLGYGRIADWVEMDGMHVWLHVGYVHPQWRNHGLGTALLCRLEEAIDALATEAGGPWEYAANANSTEPQATQLLRDHGYRVAYTVLEMGLDWDAFETSLERTSWPSGFTTRPVTADALPAVAAAVAEAYRDEYPGGRFGQLVDELEYVATLSQPPFELGLMQVAWRDGEVAGQVIPRIERGRAEVYDVSVRPAYRRHGLARALLTRALLELRARGVDVARLHTVTEFPTRARDLYGALGFRVLKEFSRYRKPARVEPGPKR